MRGAGEEKRSRPVSGRRSGNGGDRPVMQFFSWVPACVRTSALRSALASSLASAAMKLGCQEGGASGERDRRSRREMSLVSERRSRFTMREEKKSCRGRKRRRVREREGVGWHTRSVFLKWVSHCSAASRVFLSPGEGKGERERKRKSCLRGKMGLFKFFFLDRWSEDEH